MNERSDERLSTADIAAGGQRPTATGEASPGSDDDARLAAQERAFQQLEDRDRGGGRAETGPAEETTAGSGVGQAPTGDAGESAAVPGGGRGSTTDADERPAPLFTDQDAEAYRGRWREVQAGFVDDPRNAVQIADSMVAELMQKLAEGFASQRAGLEQQWDRQGEPSTEELRVTLRRYRSFFDRLLSL